MRSLPLSKKTLSPTQHLGCKDLGLQMARVNGRKEGEMEVRKASVNRLSKTGPDRVRETDTCPQRSWASLLFPEGKQHSGWLNRDIFPSGQGEFPGQDVGQGQGRRFCSIQINGSCFFILHHFSFRKFLGGAPLSDSGENPY